MIDVGSFHGYTLGNLCYNSDMMLYSKQSYPNRFAVRLSAAFFLIAAWCFAGFSSFAGADASAPAGPIVPQAINWVGGSRQAEIGNQAVIHVPAGFRFTDPDGGRAILKSMRSPVPDNLAGILMPENGSWVVLFEQNGGGRLSDADKNSLDAESILRGLDKWTERQNRSRKEAGLPLISHLTWESKPAYDESRHMLDWATRATEGDGENKFTINRTFRLLGRWGTLDAALVHSGAETVAPGVLKALLSNVSFKPGFRYEDFKPGDKVTETSLAQSIIDSSTAEAQIETPELASRYGTWVGFGAVMVAAAVVGILMARRSRRIHAAAPAAPKSAPAAQPIPAKTVAKPAPPLPPLVAVANGHTAHANGRSNGQHYQSQPRPSSIKIQPNGFHRNGVSAKSPEGRKKRMFNYHKFYTDMVMQGSGTSGGDNFANEFEVSRYVHTLLGGNAAYLPQPGQATQPQPVNAQQEANNKEAARLVNSHSELLATQKALIGEQTRLIEAQARLIGEKSQMIAEKNQLLKRQSEMIDNNML
jgi:uncharacterized membrane-anchored protein